MSEMRNWLLCLALPTTLSFVGGCTEAQGVDLGNGEELWAADLPAGAGEVPVVETEIETAPEKSTAQTSPSSAPAPVQSKPAPTSGHCHPAISKLLGRVSLRARSVLNGAGLVAFFEAR